MNFSTYNNTDYEIKAGDILVATKPKRSRVRQCLVCAKETENECPTCNAALYCSVEHQQKDKHVCYTMSEDELSKILDVPRLIKSEIELERLEGRVKAIEDKFWVPGHKISWLNNAAQFHVDFRVGNILGVHIFHNSGLLDDSSVMFHPYSNTNEGVKNVTLKGRAYGFPFNTLRAGYLVCYKDKNQHEQRIQVDTMTAARNLLSLEGATDVETFNYSKLFPNSDSLDNPSFINPAVFDVLLSDVQEQHLHEEIAIRLKVNYLGDRDNVDNSRKTIRGIVFGHNYRPMVNLIIASEEYKKPINVIFLIDTGSPSFYICEEAMQALGYNHSKPKSFNVLFGGVVTQACKSCNHFADINLIGTSFLRDTNALLEVDYKMLTIELKFH